MDYQELVESLKRIILPILEEKKIELVELDFIRAQGRPVLRLLVDKQDEGISLDECAYLNQELSRILDERDMIEARYILEVSSPGIDRPLKQKQDFLRCLNRKVRFFLREPLNGKLELDGEILKIEGDSVYIELEGETLEIPLSKINKAKQVIQ